MSLSQSQGQNKAMNIAQAKRPNPLGEKDSAPLTESVQENFRGFTYTGESVMVSIHTSSWI
jgi:protein-serine/threonine kinase